MLATVIKNTIREIPDFPKLGISFKDITPILKDAKLCSAIIDELYKQLSNLQFDAVAAVESRGFLFGLMLANRMGKPFIPIRKKGKLPFITVQQQYNLEYGQATLEIHKDAFEKGAKILIHDDLLATGGTVIATSSLIKQLGGSVAGFSFIIDLGFLNGAEKLKTESKNIYALASY
ncbi:MAG: adenine phosphoribosyltransferase [Sphingobacteriales bacterium]|nr:MAG: adenine phosphoribosyltransferase [Sphingobacteriales bacterium]TAF79824.1 MAG: adenine phosphoribosyltransferase [Sphingobacteriales bacterium]